MNEWEREMAKVTASSIRLRLHVARDEKWIRWVIGATSVVAGVGFLWRGEYGFACMTVFASFYYCIVTPRAEASGMRRGWGMAWMTITQMLYDTEDVSEIRQQAMVSARLPINERIELDQARMMLKDIEEMLRRDEDR